MELTKNILDAQVYAFKELINKTYGYNVPYSVHLIHVVSVVQKFLHLIPPKHREAVIVAAWLHDVGEDAGISFNKIKKRFGEDVANIVYCVTNELGRNRSEKAIKTYPKTAENRLAVFVKLADRIANTSHSKMTYHPKENTMYETYVKEFDYFYEILHNPGEYEEMWTYLESFIDRNFFDTANVEVKSATV